MGNEYRGIDPHDNPDDDYPPAHPVAPRVLGSNTPPPRQAPARPAAYQPPAPGTRRPKAEPLPDPGPGRPPRRNTGNACIWLLGLAALVVLACTLLGVGAMQNGVSGLFGWRAAFPNLFQLTPTVVIQSGPSVVQQIQSFSRLETAQYTLEKVVTGESSSVLPFSTDKILFIAHGQVVAGVDLSKISDADVQVVSNTVTIRMPPSEIFSSNLDNGKSRVYDRQIGILGRPDPDLESRIRQQAEQEMSQEARESGILKTAQDNAQKTLRVLLSSLHYDQVTFTVREATPGPSLTAQPAATATP